VYILVGRDNMTQNTDINANNSQAGPTSCLNRNNQGTLSSRVVMSNECQHTYNDLSARFFCLFSPRDIFEHELVTNMVNARWKIRRLEAACSANLDLAMEEARLEFEQKYANLDIPHEHALAYRAIAQSSSNADLMGRNEDRQHRVFERSYRLIAKHRGKLGAIPSAADLAEAESHLPADNLPPREPQPGYNSLQPNPFTQNRTLEPEPPPKVVVLQPKAKAKQQKEPDHPRIFTHEEFGILTPMFEWLKEHEGLRIEVAEVIRNYRDKHGIDLAA
jgi:hypothetical protein